MKQELDHGGGDHARAHGDPHSPGDLTPPRRRARLAEESHEGAHDENRLESLAQQQQERLAQETRPGAAIGDEPLRPLQPREHAGARLCHVGAGRTVSLPGHCDAGAQPAEGILQLGGEAGVAHPHVGLHLLEGQVGSEHHPVRARRDRRVELAPDGGEHRRRSGAAVRQRRHVGGDRPAIGVGERLFEGRHRRTGDAEHDLAIDVDGRDGAHHGEISEVGGWRAFETPGLGTVAAAGVAVTGGALLAEDLHAARQRGRLRRDRDDRPRPPHRRGDAPRHEIGEALRVGRRRRALEQGAQGSEGTIAEGAHRPRQEGDVKAGLIDELLRFVDLLGTIDTTPAGWHPGGVLLGRQSRGGDDASGGAERVRRLPCE